MRKRHTIWDEMQRIQEEMNSLFNNFWDFEPEDTKLLSGPVESREISKYRQPLADIWETDNEVIATLEMPGVDKNDIQINVNENNLEIKVEKKQEKEDKKKGMYRLERSYKGFYRRFSLPTNVKADKANATYKNGVLEIKIPKSKEEKEKTKQIKVN